MSAIQSLPYVEVGDVSPINVGGSSGLSADVTVAEGALAACGGFGDGDVALFPVGDDLWRAQPGERFRLQSVDVDGQTVTVLIGGDQSPARSVSELEAFFEFSDRVVQSVNF